MFGYVKVHAPELKVKEYDFYKSVYCGLCRSMGKCTGCGSRMTLSYDFVFLALVRLGVNGDEMSFSKKRCFMKRCSMPTLDECESLRYCASAAALLSYYKVLDDLRDSKGFKKLGAALLLPYASRMRRRAGLSELDYEIKSGMDALCAAEEKEDLSPDEAADMFGRILSSIASYGVENRVVKDALKDLGLRVGRWIYLADAADDLKGDIKAGRKNPFKLSMGEKPSESDTERLSVAMTMELSEAAKLISEFEIRDKGIENIINNILYLGMPRVQMKICDSLRTEKGESCSCERNSK
ncbi:MAG: hypothetical protein E7623_02650 [Ruminococcaceae bacterium]|nr:hypothetical protein [Oscillospiraceae bacterium]